MAASLRATSRRARTYSFITAGMFFALVCLTLYPGLRWVSWAGRRVLFISLWFTALGTFCLARGLLACVEDSEPQAREGDGAGSGRTEEVGHSAG
jgi:hypothetical protein